MEEETVNKEKINLEELLPGDIYEVINICIAMLAEQAWIQMGLHLNPATKEIKKDIQQASLAIDCLQSLIEKTEDKLDEKTKSEIKNLLSNLRLNFVQQSQV
ncbi:MAG: DUF1844 domain-containing protein [Firmicutes bacterium]|nr:DUF1844 domain-containing protein [Bacillota bacterium]